MNGLPSVGPLNLPVGVLPRRLSAVEPNVTEQLAELRVEIVALRSLFETALEMLAASETPGDVARFLLTAHVPVPKAGCRCSLHNRAA